MSAITHVESSFQNETATRDSSLLTRVTQIFSGFSNAVAAARMAEELHYVSDVQLEAAGTSRTRILTSVMNRG